MICQSKCSCPTAENLQNMHPPSPLNEAQRLVALESLHVLDSPSEASFDELTALASQICGTPIALVSLVDRDRQWFKSHHGLEVTQTPRDTAFCAHAINAPDEMMEVRDATLDPRFIDNPLVTGDPAIRFYAGAPLISADGYTLGTLCVIDRRARTLDAGQRTALQVLARQVVAQLERRGQSIARKKQVEELIELKNLDIEQRNAMLTAGLDLKAFLGIDLVYRFVNRTYLGYWQKTGEEIIGKSVCDLMGDETYQRVKPMLERCLRGETVSYESEFQFPGKGRRYMAVSYIPARNAKDEIIGIVVRVHDIDHLKRTEEHLNASIQQLLEFTDSQQQFIYVLSHDLREPINTIINFSSLLEGDFAHELSPPAKSFTSFISSGARRMKALLDDLIQYVSLGNVDPEMQDCDLDQTVKNVLADLADSIARNGANITVSVLPVIRGRASPIHLLLQNMVANATKFHRPGVAPQVDIRVLTLADEWQISVKDNGIGIDGKLLPTLFQTFRRLNSPKEFAGSGLGLAMVKKIAEMHGGRAWITSTKGVGSEVFATIAKNPKTNGLATPQSGGNP